VPPAAVRTSPATGGAVAGDAAARGALGPAAVVGGAAAVGDVGIVEVDEPPVEVALWSACDGGVCAGTALLGGFGPEASLVPALSPAPPLGVWLDA
jgi:hypothetical protein